MRMEGELRSDLEWEVITSQIPSKKNQYQIGNNKHGERYIIKSEKVREYEREFARQCKIYKNRNIDRPCKLHVVVYESSWAYDIDNSLGCLCDCLQYNNCLTNDNRILSIDCRKVIDPLNPRVAFAIEELEPRLF